MRKWGPLDWAALIFILFCIALGVQAVLNGVAK